MTGFFTAVFWKEAWVWCKVNWKFILGLSIPIILSILARKGNMKKVLQARIKARDQELEIERRAAGLETERKGQAQKDFIDTINKVNKDHEAALIDLADERKKREESITDPSDATKELADKFNLENQDED